ncbi:sporulation protein [Yinghuangia sp. YIM S09857]|uniref:sporulation protein n=1 Tax=Yinghuangia sp. YIM S09857 TaxID=3436929 RepID=UPI003F537870
MAENSAIARRAAPVSKSPNTDLARLIEKSGASHKAIAFRVNELAARAGVACEYTHTSVANWCRRGMTPRWPTPKFLALALGERLGHPVTLRDLGMAAAETPDRDLGLDFPRNPADAVREATEFWSTVHRRDFLTGAFSVGAFATPTTRWLAVPADPAADHPGTVRVGRSDLGELAEAADEARRWDSKYGGGNWRASSVAACLRERAAPLLRGTFTDAVGRELFSTTSELSRLAGWTAFDTGQHDAAQRYFIQALRLARAGGDVQLGCYVLTTMAMQALMRGFHTEAIDMAEGAFERARGRATPRVLGFTKLIEARAHARARDSGAASAALAASEDLLSRAATESGDEPNWIDFFTHARLSADATEVFRDLRNPKASLAWEQRAAMPAGVFTRSVGMRLAIVATAHLQARDLDHGLELGHQSIDILARVNSTRALDYVRELTTALIAWRREAQVVEFIHRARTELSIAT